MPLRVAAYENGDHTCIIWFPGDLAPIAGCRGFAILRKRTSGDGTKDEAYLRNYVGFEDGDDPPAEGSEWKWPIQRFLWWDYAVHPGDTVSYQVVPVIGPAANLQLVPNQASALTAPLTLTGQTSQHISAYFNKGIIASQWVARELAREAQNQAGQKSTMQSVIKKIGDPLRNALGGLLRAQILAELEKVAANGGSIYAALYELNDPELLAAFTKLGARVNLILANGAFKKNSRNAPPTDDASRALADENFKVRADLKKLKTIKVYDRIVPDGHFAHNKFLVFCDADGKATKVLSGSTNWTMTGLCTQANNGIFIDDAKVAGAFRDEWDRLKAAKNDFPADLVQANSKQKIFTVDDAQVTTWFAPTSKQQDMVQARTLIEGATDGALFLFFNPGRFAEDEDQQTLLQTVIDRGRTGTPHYDANLYIRGVVNQKIAGLTDDDTSAAAAGKGQVKKIAQNSEEQDDSHDPTASLYARAVVRARHRAEARPQGRAGAGGDQGQVQPLGPGASEHGRDGPQQGDRARSLRRPSRRDDRLAQSRHQSQPRQRRQPHHRRRPGRTESRHRLRREHHRDLSGVPLAHLRRRTRSRSQGLARPAGHRHVAGRSPDGRKRRIAVLDRRWKSLGAGQSGQGRRCHARRVADNGEGSSRQEDPEEGRIKTDGTGEENARGAIRTDGWLSFLGNSIPLGQSSISADSPTQTERHLDAQMSTLRAFRPSIAAFSLSRRPVRPVAGRPRPR